MRYKATVVLLLLSVKDMLKITDMVKSIYTKLWPILFVVGGKLYIFNIKQVSKASKFNEYKHTNKTALYSCCI